MSAKWLRSKAIICLGILYGWKLLEMLLFMFLSSFVLIKVTWDAFVCVLNVYNFFHKKIKTVLIPSISILLLKSAMDWDEFSITCHFEYKEKNVCLNTYTVKTKSECKKMLFYYQLFVRQKMTRRAHNIQILQFYDSWHRNSGSNE